MIAPKTVNRSPAEQKRADKDAYELVKLRDMDLCVMRSWDCMGGIQCDHRQNRQSGNTVPSNLQMLCLLHHQWKTEHPSDAIDQGYALSRYQDFREWPARRWVRTAAGLLRPSWVLYLDEHDTADRLWIEISEADALARMGRTS